MLCGKGATTYSADSSKSSSNVVVDTSKSASRVDTSKSSSNYYDSSYPTTVAGRFKGKVQRKKPSHDPVVIRLCRDKYCKKVSARVPS